MRRSLPLAFVCALLAHQAVADTHEFTATAGADVIVGVLPDISNHGAVGSTRAYSIGTTSCNIGGAELNWIANDNRHPVIGGNIYQVANGRMRQVGYSWLKHGFTALQQNACGLGCQSSGTGSRLGIGCSDPYTSSLNGGRPMGLRREVNATRGYYPNTWQEPACSDGSCDAIEQRTQVDVADLTNDNGELYFYESQYVTADDAMNGNGLNNASYRPISVNDSFSISLTGGTVQMLPAIYAWQVADPQVFIDAVTFSTTGGEAPAPDDRYPALPDPPELLHVATRIHAEGGGVFRWEIAVHNLNSHRAVRSVGVPIPAGAELLSASMHLVETHSGEDTIIFDDGFESGDTAWWGIENWRSPASFVAGVGGETATFETRPFGHTQRARELLWGRTYSFTLLVSAAPAPGSQIELGLFRPGVPVSVSANMLP